MGHVALWWRGGLQLCHDTACRAPHLLPIDMVSSRNSALTAFHTTNNFRERHHLVVEFASVGDALCGRHVPLEEANTLERSMGGGQYRTSLLGAFQLALQECEREYCDPDTVVELIKVVQVFVWSVRSDRTGVCVVRDV